MVLVSVSEGVLEGEVLDNEYGGSYCSFKGIPYAEPPVGDLRFKAPQPPKQWKGTRSAKEFGPISIQYNILLEPSPLVGSDDCLYLNVYTPRINPDTPLPVMVWIHGGAFAWGSGNDDFYGPEFLVKHNVILVTFNYRLEALGFLCLDTEDIPGNAGMKDQVAALRWVKKNIKNFGGDPNNVTIFGESAGGTSVSFHLLSPMSKGLFKRAIVQSGSATCFWAQPFEPRERALALARQLGFYSEDNKELYEFFKNLPIEKLVNIKTPITRDGRINDLHFGIVSEKKIGNNERFFYGDVIDALTNNIHDDVEIMIGYTKDEGLMAFFGHELDTTIANMNTYRDSFVSKPIKIAHPIKAHLEISKKMKEYYFGKAAITNEKTKDIIRYLNLEYFVYGIVLFAKFYSRINKVYMYKVTCDTNRNILSNVFGFGELIRNTKVVCHADDLMYLFPMKITNLKVEKDSEEEKMINRICSMWTNFAKLGNPTPNSFGVKWEPFTVKDKSYMNIGNELAMEANPEGNEMAFWESIFKEYLPKWTA